MERCPQCRARLKGRKVCGRCECDLGILYAIESSAEICSRLAVKALLVGELHEAEKQAAAAEELHATLFNRALVGFMATLKKAPNRA